MDHVRVTKNQEMVNQVHKACYSYLIACPPYLPCGNGYSVGGDLSSSSLSLQVKYKKAALDNYPNFTSVEDPPEIVLAKINSVNQSDVSLLCV